MIFNSRFEWFRWIHDSILINMILTALVLQILVLQWYYAILSIYSMQIVGFIDCVITRVHIIQTSILCICSMLKPYLIDKKHIICDDSFLLDLFVPLPNCCMAVLHRWEKPVCVMFGRKHICRYPKLCVRARDYHASCPRFESRSNRCGVGRREVLT